MVVVWYQRLFGSLLHGPSGGCTSMKYVAGPRSLICDEAGVVGAVGQAVAAAERVVVVVDGDGAVGLLLQPDLEAVQAGLLGVGRAVGPGVVVEDEDADLAERQRMVVALLGQVDARRSGCRWRRRRRAA